MDKETSSRVSTIAARVLNIDLDTSPKFGDLDAQVFVETLLSDAKTLAGSCMSQDETPGQQPETFTDRVKRERAHLSGKIDALNLVIQRCMPEISDEQQKLLLEVQLSAMTLYRTILDARLRRLFHTGEPLPTKDKSPVASEQPIGEPVEIGGHDQDREGAPKFSG